MPRLILSFLMAALLLPVVAPAQRLDPVTQSRRNAIVTAIERVSPAVITLNVVQVQTQQLIDPFFEEFWGLFGDLRGRTRTRQRAIESIGSGFIFTPEGHILTNYHVLQNASAISSVSLPDGRNLEVELVGVDQRADIAVLKALNAGNLPYIPLGDSEDLMVGEWVIAIGNPFGNLMGDPQPSVSVGVVSANHRRVARTVAGGEHLYQDLIQTDAAINPGNSGGPLVNANGEVIGINTMIFSNTGGSQGLGFAIPANRVKRVVDEILQYGRRRNPWMGFHGEAISALNSYALQKFSVQAREGVLITEIMTTAPAYRAGLRLGDVVTRVNNEPVQHPLDIDFVNWGLFVGDEVRLEINRGGQTSEISFQIEDLGRE